MVTAGLVHTWTGWDASSWDLTNGTQGVRLVTGSVRGMNMPPVQQYRSEAPTVAGSRYRGTRVLQREVFWPILTQAFDGSASDFVTVDRAFFKTMDPSKVGTWTVAQPSGSTRSLDLRFESTEDGYDEDPAYNKHAVYGLTFIAEQPFWRGDAVTTSFTGTGSDTIVNGGDVPGWLTWTLTGPIAANAHVGMSGAHILIPVAVPSGHTLTIYTQPDLMVALWDDGTELILDSDPDDSVIYAKYKAVTEDHTTTLNVVQSGGTITATLVPYYFRAY